MSFQTAANTVLRIEIAIATAVAIAILVSALCDLLEFSQRL